MSVVDSSFGQPMKLEEAASAPLAGGIMNHGFQCGMIWGASLAAGAEAYRRFGPSPEAEAAAIKATQRAMESFQPHTKNEINCSEISEITKMDMEDSVGMLKFMVKGGPIACFRLAARYAPDAFSSINEALSEEQPEVPSQPVSCAALLARQMGASEMHIVMASGFAGGVGLYGGACGALGAAMWLTAMTSHKEGANKAGYFDNPAYSAVIERFVESTDCEFECSEIVGRKFEGIDDHTDYLREGGCSEIIEALAAHVGESA